MTFQHIKKKLLEWLYRYLPAEILAIIGAVVGGLVIHWLFNNPILTALGGTWGENAGYYSRIFFVEIKKRKQKDGELNLAGILKVLRDVVLEFGPGEYFDSFVVRPFAMYYFSQNMSNIALGLLAGKLSADVIFYIFTITAYELKKKVIKD